MPRIITAPTTPATVKALKRIALQNRRSTGREALVAVEEHIRNNQQKTKQP